MRAMGPGALVTTPSQADNPTMPMSAYQCLPHVLDVLVRAQPASVLDVGAGFGKYGFLLREYLDVWHGRYPRGDWKLRLDMAEAHAAYVQPWHHLIYDRVLIGDVRELLPQLDDYDAILLMDVIEHFERAEVVPLLRRLADRCRLLAVSTPVRVKEQGGIFGNEWERHRTQVTRRMLREAGSRHGRCVAGTRVAFFVSDRALEDRLFGWRSAIRRGAIDFLVEHEWANNLTRALTGKAAGAVPRLRP